MMPPVCTVKAPLGHLSLGADYISGVTSKRKFRYETEEVRQLFIVKLEGGRCSPH